jgi:hypothetical protein
MQTALLRRQCGLWVLIRLVYMVVLAVAVSSSGEKSANNVWHIQPVVIVLCAFLGAVDVRRRGERLLIGNLGISRYRLAWLLAAPPFVAEVLVAIVGSV